METRVREVELAVEAGATEIDIVINRTLVLEGRWEELYEEVEDFQIWKFLSWCKANFVKRYIYHLYLYVPEIKKSHFLT